MIGYSLILAVGIFGNSIIDTINSSKQKKKLFMFVMWGMLISMVMAALVVGPVLLLLGQAARMRIAAACAVLLAELGISLLLLRKVGEPRLARLEP